MDNVQIKRYTGRCPKKHVENINLTDHNIFGVKKWTNKRYVERLWKSARASSLTFGKANEYGLSVRGKHILEQCRNY